MLIIIQTQYYPPEIGAPQSRLSELAQELTKINIKVVVLTAMPNYPIGKIFPGYKGLFRKENLGGITVYRSYIFPTQSTNFIKRLLNYLSFVFSSLWVGLFLPKSDFLITESPPLFLGLSGYLLSRGKRAKWIFNVADLWPASVVELGIIKKNSFMFKISNRMESFFYHHAAFVTGQSKTILENITHRYPEIITYHLSNGVNPEKYKLTETKNDGKIKVMYAGLHGLAQGLDQIIVAARNLKNQQNIEFIFIGDGPKKLDLVHQVNDSGLNNVTFLNPIPKSQIPEELAKADILIVPLKVQLTGAVPSKLYEGMAAGKPIILIAESEAAEIVINADCGIVVTPGDVEALTSAIQLLSANSEERKRLGTNGRKAVCENFDRRKIVQDFASFLQKSFTEEK